MNQRKLVIKELLQTGQISRNYCLSLGITRLGAIVEKLNKNGWELKGKYIKTNGGKDYVYFLKGSPYKKVVYKVEVDGEIKEIISYEKRI